MTNALRSELGLSADQFYRRVKALRDADLIRPEKGSQNRLLFSPAEADVLRGFARIEQDSPERSLQWCIERLRYELEHTRAETLASSLDFSRIEVRQLRGALVRARRHALRRLLFWVRRLVKGEA
jgi:hypothetical protein